MLELFWQSAVWICKNKSVLEFGEDGIGRMRQSVELERVEVVEAQSFNDILASKYQIAVINETLSADPRAEHGVDRALFCFRVFELGRAIIALLLFCNAFLSALCQQWTIQKQLVHFVLEIFVILESADCLLKEGQKVHHIACLEALFLSQFEDHKRGSEECVDPFQQVVVEYQYLQLIISRSDF